MGYKWIELNRCAVTVLWVLNDSLEAGNRPEVVDADIAEQSGWPREGLD